MVQGVFSNIGETAHSTLLSVYKKEKKYNASGKIRGIALLLKDKKKSHTMGIGYC
jgi:hypothetical protein